MDPGLKQKLKSLEYLQVKSRLDFVHDNAANVMAALKMFEERHGISSIRCAGHTLQLVVNHVLKNPQITKAIEAARSLVEHFKKSEAASSKLKTKKLGQPEHKLIQDVSVRWNSSYYMISRLLEQRWTITACLSDQEVTHRSKHFLDLNAEQWCLLEQFEQLSDHLSVLLFILVRSHMWPSPLCFHSLKD